MSFEYDFDARLEKIAVLTAALKDAREELLQERARRSAALKMTPAEHLEALRTHALRRATEDKEVWFYDSEFGTVRAEPWPAKSCWRMNNERGEFHETKERVFERIAKATMFGAEVEP